MSPSKIKGIFPIDSITQNNESEVVAKNIMIILARTGDTFRELSIEEYKKERNLDYELNSSAQTVGLKEISVFDKVKDVANSIENASRFCKDWKSALKY